MIWKKIVLFRFTLTTRFQLSKHIGRVRKVDRSDFFFFFFFSLLRLFGITKINDASNRSAQKKKKKKIRKTERAPSQKIVCSSGFVGECTVCLIPLYHAMDSPLALLGENQYTDHKKLITAIICEHAPSKC